MLTLDGAVRLFPYLAFLYLVKEGKFSIFPNGKVMRWESVGVWRPASRRNRNGYYRVPFRFQGTRFEIMELELVTQSQNLRHAARMRLAGAVGGRR